MARSLKAILRRISKIIYEKTHLKSLHLRLKLNKLLRNTYGYGTIKKPKISIALVTRDGTTHPTSSAFIRLISPLSNLSADNSISFKIFRQNTTKFPDDINICIVQRTAYDNKDNAKKLVSTLKKQDIKLIIDNDDAFSLMDDSHAEYTIQGDRHLALEYLIKNADQIWVSTQSLARQHKRSNPSVCVISNTLDKRLWRQDHTPSLKGRLQMVYMGTATHDDDFKMLLGALDVLAKKYPKSFKLSVIGVSSCELPKRRWIKRLYQPRGHAIYPKFVDWFIKQGPFDIGLCPLVESPFNNYKSDIKCLDYIGINAMPITSNVPAYNTTELNDYIVRIDNTQALWINELGKILAKPDKFRRDWQKTSKKAQSYLWDKRSSEVVSRKILKLLNSLM